jgi:hypothetical protein
MCKGWRRGGCITPTITIPVAWHIVPVGHDRTNARSPITTNSESLIKKGHCSGVGMSPAFDRKLLFELVSTLRSTLSFLGSLRCLHLPDQVQRTIWTACLLNWSDFTSLADAVVQISFESLRWLKWWSCSKWHVKSANLLTQQAMLFDSSTVVIAHHLAKSSRVLIPGYRIVVICVIDAWVTVLSLLQRHLAAYTSSTSYWNTFLGDFVCKIWKVAS